MSEGIERPSDQPRDGFIEAAHCPRCGSANDASGAFCGRCGWRLDIAQNPNPGRLGLAIVLVAASFAVAIGFAILRPGPGSTAADSAAADPAITSSTEYANQRVAALSAVSVTSPTRSNGSELERLTDDDPLTLWFHEIGDEPIATMILTFTPSATFTEVVFQNVEEGPAFARHSRIRDVELSFEGSTQLVAAELPDTPGRHRVQIPDVATGQVTVRVVSVYPGQELAGEAPFDELAIAEITFQGFDGSSS